MKSQQVLEAINEAKKNNQKAFGFLFDNFWDYLYNYLLKKTIMKTRQKTLLFKLLLKHLTRSKLSTLNTPSKLG